MSEPNEVNEEQLDQEQQAENQSSAPTPPKKPNLRMAGRTAVKTTAKIARKVMQVFAVMPLPVKIAIVSIIAIVILVVVVLKADAEESTNQLTESINEVVKNNENLSDEAKESYQKSGSLIKFPIEELLKMYDYYTEEGEFSGSSIRKNYTYVIGTNDVEIKEGTGSSSVSGDMEGLVKKAKELAEKGGVKYSQGSRELVSTVEELDNVKNWDCSSFVYSMFKACLGIDVSSQTEAIKSKGDEHYSENGWTAEVHAIGEGDMQPGDILYRYNHVGIYVGDNKQVDHGGPGGTEGGNSWTGPKYKDVSSSYTHYIRYTKQ